MIEIEPAIFKSKYIKRITFILLAVLACAFANMQMNGEVVSWQVYFLSNVNNVEGSSALVNGELVRGEGLSNVQNADHFAGGDAQINFSYDLAISRLGIAYLASILNLIMPDAISSIQLLNILFWMLAAASAYIFALYELRDEKFAFIFGMSIVGGIGFISTFLGTKGHLPSFGWFVFLFALSSLLGIPSKEGNFRSYAAVAIAAGLGAFFNNVWVAFVLVFLFTALIRRASLRHTIMVMVSPVILSALMRLIVTISYPGGTDTDRTFSYILKTFSSHIYSGIEHLFSPEKEYLFELVTTTKRVLSFDSFFGPFLWINGFIENIIFLGGVVILVFSALALATPLSRATWWGLGIIFTVSGVVFGVQTYWPQHMFWAYTTYSAFFGFHLLATKGLLNLADGICYLVERLSNIEIGRRLSQLTIILGLALIIGHSNQHLINGHLIEVIRFHNRATINYPADWPFEAVRW